MGVNMETELYETMYKRKSVRKYDMAPLDSSILQSIKEFSETVEPLVSGINVKFGFFSNEEVKSLMAIKAPHYVGIYSEHKENYLLNAGYMLQQMDLFLSKNNLGSCWLGMAKPSAALPESMYGLSFVIMLAFGKAQEEVHRNSTDEFKRKEMNEITDRKDSTELLEAVRLAPSATNSQNWYFTGDSDIIACRKHTGLLKEPIMARLNTIDMGIALCHLSLSIKNQGKSMKVEFNKTPVPKGFIYLATIRTV
jgi:nitroreductase